MNRRSFLRAAPVAGVALAVPAVALAETPDADLINLGFAFDAAYSEEQAARAIGRETGDWDKWDDAYARSGAIVRQIEAVPATTLDGLRVKARCIQWCYGDDPIDLEGTSNTMDMRLAQQIVTSLLTPVAS